MKDTKKIQQKKIAELMKKQKGDGKKLKQEEGLNNLNVEDKWVVEVNTTCKKPFIEKVKLLKAK